MTPEAPIRATREPSAGGKRLVLVVHGLGDDPPGDKVRDVACGLAAARGRSRSAVEEVLWLHQGAERQVDECEFPCRVERVRDGEAETVLAEVYWADHSGMGRGILAVLGGIFRLVFGLHQAVARHAPDPARREGRAREPAAAVFRRLSMAAAYLLRGPAVAALLSWVLFAVVFAVWGLTVEIWDPAAGGFLGDDPQGGRVRWLSVVSNLIGLVVGGAGLAWLRGRPLRAPFLWLTLISLAWELVWLLSAIRPSLVTPFWSEQVELGQAWAYTALRAVSQLPSLAYFVVLVAAVAWLVARLRAEPVYRPGLDLAQAVNSLALGLWLLLVQFLLLLGSRFLPSEATPSEADAVFAALAAAVASGGIQLVILAVPVLATLAWKARWNGRTRASSYRADRPVPRLFLGGAIGATLICLPFASLAFAFEPRLWRALQDSPVATFVTLAVPVVAGVAAYASDGVRFIVDFFLDFVSHFERWTPEAGGGAAYVRRERIRERLRIVMRTLVRRERPDAVTVLAHSQGTVVSLETLAGEGAGALLEPLTRCDLVTMGSPFHHVYQHYFPNDYPPLAHPRWGGLRRRIDRWVNIFRIDDYFGTDIEPGGEWPENLPVDAGGHGGYWSDRQVLEILDRRGLV